MSGIEIGGEGSAALHLELGNDGGVRVITLSYSPDEGDPAEIVIELDQVDELVQALRRALSS